ncbi:DUF6708 domain-containing protein [Pseudomonas ovata]|uniref:DUF6708 domain-containing protein n=1 Tax=Pseudomonas ovata TaxID=1839709 RepID=UPI000D694AD1|nr:DUF6708 domain-containing protein [Pseudomonas ovata]
MSLPPSGTCKKGFFSRQDYLAPLPLPTGQKPSDGMRIIWRKNDVFMDISNYSIGSGIMILWPIIIIFCSLAYFTDDINFLILGAVITVPSCLRLIYLLFRPTPLPIRFNRQRREACFLKRSGEYWIVPWESVVAAATQASSTSQGGKMTYGMLVVSLENPDPNATKDNQHFTMGFGCGGGEAAMALWECIRCYMEIGPDAVEDQTFQYNRPGKNIFTCYKEDFIEFAHRRGWVLAFLWEGLVGLFIFNSLLIYAVVKLKISPPPDLDHPDIIEWSRPLPPEQWAKPSAELQAALAEMGLEAEVKI